MPQFEKISLGKFRSKSSIIAEQILLMIKTNQYPAGSKLPPERIIADQMGVSRPSVREAISALQIVGILETHPGDGTYVSKPFVSDNLSTELQSVFDQSDSPYEILQARKAIESGVFRMAMNVATDEDIEDIKAVWQKKYDKGLEGDYDAYTKYGKDFHLAIANATKNRLIVIVMERLLSVTNQPLWRNMRCNYYTENPTRIEEMMTVHNNIVRAFQERDSEKAIQMLEKDLDTVLEQLYNMST